MLRHRGYERAASEEADTEVETKGKEYSCNSQTAGYLSTWTFHWVTPLIRLAQNEQLRVSHLGKIRLSDEAKYSHDRFRQTYKPPGGLAWTIWKNLKWHFIAGACLRFCAETLAFVPVLLLEPLLLCINSKDVESYSRGYWIAAFIFVASVLRSLFTHNHHNTMVRVGIRVRSSLQAMILGKAMRLPVLQTYSSNPLTLLTADVETIMSCIWIFHYTWMGPLQILVTLYLLYKQMGVAALGGAVLIALMVPMQSFIGSYLQRIAKNVVRLSDKRMKFIAEALDGIKTVKVFCWENFLMKRIREVRTEELKLIWSVTRCNTLNAVVLNVLPRLASVTMFVIYGYFSSAPLTVSSAFTAVSLFGILRIPTLFLPNIINSLAASNVALERIRIFLSQPESHAVGVSDEAFNEPIGDVDEMKVAPIAIRVEKVDIPFPGTERGDARSCMLRNVCFEIPRGHVVAVTGTVGSGKTHLLLSLLREVMPSSGRVESRGTFAYCGEEPFLLNMSIRENITFGCEFDLKRFNEVVDACCLTPDLESMILGDLTIIGERGVKLSGGQRARVALARALYSRADIILLDNALSAVDPLVARHIIRHAFRGFGRGRTIVFTSTQDMHTQAADAVLEIDTDGRVSMKELTPSSNESANAAGGRVACDVESQPAIVDPIYTEDNDNGKPATNGDSAIDSKAVAWYFAACGRVLLITIAIALCIRGLMIVYSDWVLAKWSGLEEEVGDASAFVYVYIVVNVVGVVVIIASEILLSYTGTRAANSIHESFVSRLLDLSFSFFDSEPSGKIINVSSGDVGAIDTKLAPMFSLFLGQAIALISFTALQSYVYHVILIPIAINAFIFWKIQNYYRNANRQMKRIDLNAKDPVAAFMKECLNGVYSIRAGRSVSWIYSRFCDRVNVNSVATFTYSHINRWLGIRLECTGSILLFISAAGAIYWKESVRSNFAALVISAALWVTQSLYPCIRYFIESEILFSSVERLHYYSTNTSIDAGCPLKTMQRVRPEWPENGVIQFNDVSLTYNNSESLALRDVNLCIREGEKVGICGRTGSGKTSLVNTLFRAYPLCQGSITIDNVDISCISPTDVRGRIAYLPQEPVFFTGNVRLNLDPYGDFDDNDIDRVLDLVGLRKMGISRDLEIDSKGSNLSQGQRQLLGMARALLKRSNIIVLDEATSSVDSEYDQEVQRMLRNEFKSCTVLTIAHRIHTVMDYDRLIVLENGRIVESGCPRELVQRDHSFLGALMKSSIACFFPEATIPRPLSFPPANYALGEMVNFWRLYIKEILQHCSYDILSTYVMQYNRKETLQQRLLHTLSVHTMQ